MREVTKIEISETGAEYKTGQRSRAICQRGACGILFLTDKRTTYRICNLRMM